jgi:excisionase family DNA binding protein
MPLRFLTRTRVATELNISKSQCYALIRRGELRAAKIGARGDYRIGRDDLEAYIERTYAETERWVEEHPFVELQDLDALRIVEHGAVSPRQKV